MDRLHVATLNIRNFADRWTERLPLLLADMTALQPDVMGLQEVVFPMYQDHIIGAAGEGHYRTLRGWAGRPDYGNSLLLQEPLVAGEAERLDLGLNRSALRTVVVLPNGGRLRVAVTHLHHEVGGAAERDAQVGQLLEWILPTSATTAQVVMGDFNAHPREPAAERMRAGGFRSSHAEANGVEPAVTWPSGIQAPGMDTDGDPACLDYIWVRGEVRATAARVVFNRPHPGDPTLFPSDHFGLSAQLEVGGSGDWDEP
jgi:endonuclease/exonuclease/phosphatase family metal-dependent hydrolase